jgi:acetylornithine deacetylase/succinyl-diaminopimelate desuccinylase-like protein
MGVGGSIPFANVFSTQFPDAEIALIGVSDGELGNAHAPNESVELKDLEKMINALSNALTGYAN